MLILKLLWIPCQMKRTATKHLLETKIHKHQKTKEHKLILFLSLSKNEN